MKVRSEYTLQRRLPYPEQGWVEIGRVDDFGAVKDELSSPVERPLPGTLLRAIDRRRSVHWIGLADADGRMVSMPRLPRKDPGIIPGVTSWFQAWDGKRSDASWMIEAGRRVDRHLLVAVALGCGLRAESLAPDRRAAQLLEVVRRWLRGESSVAEVEQASDEADAWPEPRSRTAEVAARAALTVTGTDGFAVFHAQQATVQAMWIEHGPSFVARDEARVIAAKAQIAGVVRSIIPLGLVLLSRLQLPEVAARLEALSKTKRKFSFGG